MVGTQDLATGWYGDGISFSTAESIEMTDDVVPAETTSLQLPGEITGTVEGLAADETVCIYAFPDEGRTIMPELPAAARASLDVAPVRVAPLAAATGNPCGETPDLVMALPVFDGAYRFTALPPGSYRLYLDVSRSTELTGTGAPQWVAEKVLKTSAETVTVEAGQSVAAAGTTAFPERTFADVARGMQFFEEISWLASTGVTTGWTEGNGSKTFRPVTPIARDAMAAFIYRLAGSPEYTPPAVLPFRDVSRYNLYYKEISWLASARISTGWLETDETRTFRPLSPVARDAMAVFLYRFAEYPEFKAPVVSPFADVKTDNVYYEEISWLASTGISTGWAEANGSSIFRALSAVNRDAMAAFMERYAFLINTQP